MKSYLFVIPARGGSKGIPRKNIIEIGGKPLIAYSIQAALQALEQGIDGDMVVSTDDPEIAEVARKYGGNVPFIRPEEISGDSAKSVEFLLHAVDFFVKQGKTYDATVLLQPTSPLRTTEDIVAAKGLFETTGQPSLISVYQETHVCEYNSYHRCGNIAEPLSPLHNEGRRRQDGKPLYVRNGAIYITDIAYLQKELKVISDTPAMYVMPKNHSVDLNTLEDLELLRMYYHTNIHTA